MSKRDYLNLLMTCSPYYLWSSYSNPSKYWRPIHAALHLVALRRMGYTRNNPPTF